MEGYQDSNTHYQQYQDSHAYTNGYHDPSAAAAGYIHDTTGYSQTPATTEPELNEWDRSWNAVRAHPEDFSAWEYLIRLAEAQEGGITRDSPSENQKKVREVYDAFLAKFPLCFGYWKKYADIVHAIDGVEAAEGIFERGVAAISNSVDLWTQYSQFKIEHTEDAEAIRRLFERGANAVGLDFLSHVFWDKYIEYEDKKQNTNGVTKILERIIRIPMHQYARFFQRFQEMSSTQRPQDLVSSEEYERYVAEVKALHIQQASASEGEQPADMTPDQVEAAVRTRIQQANIEIYMRTHEETNKRWPFEAEIKRPYFHVKPMDDPQLENWRRYLDFEEREGKEDRINFLYERCLIACALYDEFWLRYARWLVSHGKLNEARSVYKRATPVFIPILRPTVKLNLALLEEERCAIDEARVIYEELMTALPGHLETMYKYVHFERRIGGKNPDELLKKLMAREGIDDRTKGFLVVQLANYVWKFSSDGGPDQARKIFTEYAEQGKLLESKYFWVNWASFEMAQPGDVAETEKRVANVFELIRNNVTIPAEHLRILYEKYLDFLLERGGSISTYNKIDSEINGPPSALAAREAEKQSKKRALEDATDPYSQGVKQARVDQQPPPNIPPADLNAAAYYGQQPGQSSQWPGYSSYPPQQPGAGAAQPYAYQYPPSTTAAAPAAPQSGWDYSQQQQGAGF